MKKLLTGLNMALGNFLVIPCPCKKWDNDLKNYMLGFLPFVGFIIGIIWAGACLLLVLGGAPFRILAFLMTFLIFALCGFMHLDGFMDCSDAIMSRKALEDRQAILKDSHCGAFAVVSVIFMILAYNTFLTTALSSGIDFPFLCIIPIVSRAIASIMVMFKKPIEHSQYADGEGAENSSQKNKVLLLILIQLIIFLAIALLISEYILATLFIALMTALGTWLSGVITSRQLGGISGDVAGLSIIWGELFGCFAMIYAGNVALLIDLF